MSARAVVATETPSTEAPSDRIVDFCHSHEIPIVVTSNELRSGSDRVWAVAQNESPRPDLIVNLQGDSPVCPPDFILKLFQALEENETAQVA